MLMATFHRQVKMLVTVWAVFVTLSIITCNAYHHLAPIPENHHQHNISVTNFMPTCHICYQHKVIIIKRN